MTAPRTPSHLNFSLLTLFLLALAHPAQAQPTPDPALQADLAYTAASAALSQQNWAEAELHGVLPLDDRRIERFNAEYNRDGLWYRYEAKRIDYYFEPTDIKFVDGKFTMK